MHTQVLFEHPLNEKMRTWLRIEFESNSSPSTCQLQTMLAHCIFSVTSAIYWMCSNGAKSVPNC